MKIVVTISLDMEIGNNEPALDLILDKVIDALGTQEQVREAGIDPLSLLYIGHRLIL